MNKEIKDKQNKMISTKSHNWKLLEGRNEYEWEDVRKYRMINYPGFCRWGTLG